MTCGIYRITNKEDGKIYIGQAKNIEKRWKTHKKAKFPEDFFIYEILMECDIEQLSFWEIAWITSERSAEFGYNKTIGGTNLNSIIFSEETKAKISAANKGNISPNKGKSLSEEHKKKISETMKGKEHSEKHKQKISEANKGRAFSEEHKLKLSEAKKCKISPIIPTCPCWLP